MNGTRAIVQKLKRREDAERVLTAIELVCEERDRLRAENERLKRRLRAEAAAKTRLRRKLVQA